MKIVRGQFKKLHKSKIQLGLVFCLVSFNSHAFLDSIYEYFSSSDEEEAVVSGDDLPEDSGYTASAQSITTGQESFNAEIIACTRRSSLNISTPGISGVMSFMDGQFCDQSRVAAISRAQGNINVENACAEVFQLKADNVCQFDENMSIAQLDRVMNEMRQSPEVREAEIRQKAEAIKNDMEKIQHLSKLHLSFASNPVVLSMIKNKLNKAKETDYALYTRLLDRYGMTSSDRIEVDVISAKAFKCSPNHMIGQSQNGVHTPSAFDEEASCSNSEQSELIAEGKRRVLENCNSSGELCPEGLTEVIANSPGRLYESMAKTAIASGLNGDGQMGSGALTSISDFGPQGGFSENDTVLSTLHLLHSASDESQSPDKVFQAAMRSDEMQGRTEVQRIQAMRATGARLTQERFSSFVIAQNDPQREAKLGVIQRITEAFISGEEDGVRSNDIQAGGHLFDREEKELREAGVVLDFSQEEASQIAGLFITLSTGANLAEDTYQRAQSFERMRSVFGLRSTDNKPFTSILGKIRNATGAEAADLNNQMRAIIRQTPYIQTIMDLNSNEEDDFNTRMEKMLLTLQASELQLQGDALSNENNLINALIIGEMDQADKAIDACNDRKSDEWKNNNFCSSLKSPAVAATALKALFEGSQVSSQDTLSKALIYCGPILQEKFEQGDARRNNLSEEGRRDSCFHISEVLYDVEESQKEDFYQRMFGLSCENRGYLGDEKSGDQSCPATSGYALEGHSISSLEAASSCMSIDTQMTIEATAGDGSEDRPTEINLAQAAIEVGNKGVTDEGVREMMSGASSKRAQRRGERRGRPSGFSGPTGIATAPAIQGSSSQTVGPRVSSDSTNALYNDPAAVTTGLAGMNASDYRSQNSAIRARNPMTTISNNSDSGLEGRDSFSDEFIGQENMLGEESSQLLARLRAKEEELDGKLKFYNDVLANREDSAGGESAAEKTLREEKEKLQAETRALEQRLREQRDATAALAASRRTPTRRSMSSITSGLSSASGGPTSSSVRSGAPTQGTSDIPAAAPSPSGVAAVPSSSGPSRSIASVGRDYDGSSEGGVVGSVASISLIESGGETHQLTNGEVTVYSSVEEAEGNIVGAGVPPSEAALNANGVILIPTETEGLFTKYVPVMEDDTVKTLDGEVEFEKVFQVWISDVGGEAPKRAPTRLQDFDFINSDLAQ